MQEQHIGGGRRRARHAGATLVELAVVLGIVGILAMVAVPSLNQFLGRAAVDAEVKELESGIHLARVVAMTRGELVTICALDGDSVVAGHLDCVAEGHDWSAGWLVFIDHGERGEVGPGDQIVKIRQAVASGASLVATTRYLTYRSNGGLLSLAAHFRALPPGALPVDLPLPGSALLCVNKPGNPRAAADDWCRS